MNRNIEDRIEKCERENQRLKKKLSRQNAMWLVVTAIAVAGSAIAAYSIRHAEFDSLRVREVVVVDKKGTVRARLGGDLPNAILRGKTIQRGSRAAGLMIYDAEGVERGGYVTQDNGNHAMLTLDAGAAGNARQAALFVAGPTGAATLKLWNADNSIALRSDGSGANMTMVNAGRVQFQEPEIKQVVAEACDAYRKFAVEQSVAEAASACSGRFTQGACRQCLDRLPD